MKKLITFMAAVFCLMSPMSAQDCYYYYHGEKMPLSEDATKIVSIAPRTENTPLSPSNGLEHCLHPHAMDLIYLWQHPVPISCQRCQIIKLTK